MADSWNKSYTLMHKNEPVAEIELDEATISISAIGQVYNGLHVPVGIRSASEQFWRDPPCRNIGVDRSGTDEARSQAICLTLRGRIEKRTLRTAVCWKKTSGIDRGKEQP